MASKAPIGFLDSGIGGVTVLTEALKILPNEDYVFFSDSINNPYGDKPDNEIISRCDYILDLLINKYGCKAIVIACNTASAKAAKSLREKYTTPIIAIEPACKMAYDLNPEGFTLIMATKGTIESEKFHKLFYKYSNEKSSVIACVGMADLIEQDRQEDLNKYLENLLQEYKNKVDNVVLGCTHYPLATENINKVLKNVKFFDGAKGTVKQLKKRLGENELLNDSQQKGSITFIDSSNESKAKEKRFFEIIKQSEEQK